MASLQFPATSCLSARSSSFSDQSHILFYSKSSSSSFFPYQSSVPRFLKSSSSSSSSASLRHGQLHLSSFCPVRASSCLISDPCPIDNVQESILKELAELKNQMKQKKKELKALAKKEEKTKKLEKKLLNKKAKARDFESSSSSLSDVECCDQSVDMKELKKGLGFAESMAETEEVISVEDPEVRDVVEKMEEKACKAEVKMMKEKSKSENKKLMKEKAKLEKKKLAMQKMEGANDCESSSSSSSSESSDDEEDCCDQIPDMKDLKLGLGFAETMTEAEEVIVSVESMETTIKPGAEPLPFSIESMEIREVLSSCITEPMEPTKAPPASTEFMETAKISPLSLETIGTAKHSLSCTESMERKNEFSSSLEPNHINLSSCVNESIGTSKASLFCTTAQEFIEHPKASLSSVIADESVKTSFPSCKSVESSKASISCIAAEESMESARLTGKIQVCVGGKCKKAGSEKLMASLRSRIPGDSGVEAVPCKCMGKCAMAINVKVQKFDEETRNLTQRHSYVGVDDADLILRHHFGGVNEIPPPRLLSLSSS